MAGLVGNDDLSLAQRPQSFLVGDAIPEPAGSTRQDEIVLLNGRQARLEIFQHTTEPQVVEKSERFVNRLPLPTWLKKTTLICDGVPVQAALREEPCAMDKQRPCATKQPCAMAAFIVITQPGRKLRNGHPPSSGDGDWQAKHLGGCCVVG